MLECSGWSEEGSCSDSLQAGGWGLPGECWSDEVQSVIRLQPEGKLGLDLLGKEGPARGLILSTTIISLSSPKTMVWSPLGELENCHGLAGRGVVVVEAEGMVLLGAPLGS